MKKSFFNFLIAAIVLPMAFISCDEIEADPAAEWDLELLRTAKIEGRVRFVDDATLPLGITEYKSLPSTFTAENIVITVWVGAPYVVPTADISYNSSTGIFTATVPVLPFGTTDVMVTYKAFDSPITRWKQIEQNIRFNADNLVDVDNAYAKETINVRWTERIEWIEVAESNITKKLYDMNYRPDLGWWEAIDRDDNIIVGTTRTYYGYVSLPDGTHPATAPAVSMVHVAGANADPGNMITIGSVEYRAQTGAFIIRNVPTNVGLRFFTPGTISNAGTDEAGRFTFLRSAAWNGDLGSNTFTAPAWNSWQNALTLSNDDYRRYVTNDATHSYLFIRN
jgi:hypothetical protein